MCLFFYRCLQKQNKTTTKSETRMTASALQQDANTEKIQKNAVYDDETKTSKFSG